MGKKKKHNGGPGLVISEISTSEPGILTPVHRPSRWITDFMGQRWDEIWAVSPLTITSVEKLMNRIWPTQVWPPKITKDHQSASMFRWNAWLFSTQSWGSTGNQVLEFWPFFASFFKHVPQPWVSQIPKTDVYTWNPLLNMIMFSNLTYPEYIIHSNLCI